MGLTILTSHSEATLQAEGIDPGLAHLDPTLPASVQDTSGVPSGVSQFVHKTHLIRGSN